VSNRREESYRGHTICVEADERLAGCWGWSYVIDGRVKSVSRISLCPGVDDALAQGMVAAQARIDELEAAGWR
jgi:hypothetical protein